MKSSTIIVLLVIIVVILGLMAHYYSSRTYTTNDTIAQIMYNLQQGNVVTGYQTKG